MGIELRNVLVPVATAMKPNSNYDHLGQSNLIQYLSEYDITMVFLLQTGETFQMGDKERREIMIDLKRIVDGQKQEDKNIDYVMGVQGGNVIQTIGNIEMAQTLGVEKIILQLSAIMGVSNPKKFVKSIDDAFEGQKILYFNPNNSVFMVGGTPENIEDPDFFEESSFDAIKISSKFFSDYERFLSRTYKRGKKVLIGDELKLFEVYAKQGQLKTMPDGIVSAWGNVIPGVWIDIWNTLKKKGSAEKHHEFIKDLKDFYYKPPSGVKNTIAAVKTILYKFEILPSFAHRAGSGLTLDDMMYIIGGYNQLCNNYKDIIHPTKGSPCA